MSNDLPPMSGPEVQKIMAHLQADQELKRSLELLRHYAGEALTNMAIAEQAMNQLGGSSKLVLASASGKQVTRDEESAIREAVAMHSTMAKNAINNVLAGYAAFRKCMGQDT